MATRDSNVKEGKFKHDFVDTLTNQYSNLNLNQSCRNKTIQSEQSKTFQTVNDRNITDRYNSNNFIQKQQYNQNYESKKLDRINLNKNTESNSKMLNTNKASTLSLHLTAYENSVEAQKSHDSSHLPSSFSSTNKNNLNWKNAKKFDVRNSSPLSQNAFEMPRQQKESTMSDPEVMQFKASQKLLNPNEASSSKPNQKQGKSAELKLSESGSTTSGSTTSGSTISGDNVELTKVIPQDAKCSKCNLMNNNDKKKGPQPKQKRSSSNDENGNIGDSNRLIKCAICNSCFHLGCANLEKFERTLFAEFHCIDCSATKGPSILKPFISPHRFHFWKPSTNKPIQIGTKAWIADFEKIEASTPACKLTEYKTGHDFVKDFDFQHVWKEPLIVLNKEGLQMKLPDQLSVKDIVELVSRDEQIKVIDVYEQKTIVMSLGAFYDRWEQRPRERLYNMLSFEFSHTKLAEIIRAPDIMYQLSWVHKIWSIDDDVSKAIVLPEHIDSKPKVDSFCLLGMAGSYTDFHIDFGGSSVWYHVFKGQKVFYVIEPTKENLDYFVEWSQKTNQSEIFLNDFIPAKPMKRVVIEEGRTLMIPSGWIHAVYTPVDSIVFGGNFLHDLNIASQLQVYDIELDLKYDSSFTFPDFELINWYAAYRASQGRRSDFTADIINGYKALIPRLKRWQKRDQESDPNYKMANCFNAAITKLQSMFQNSRKKSEESYKPGGTRKKQIKAASAKMGPSSSSNNNRVPKNRAKTDDSNVPSKKKKPNPSDQ